MTAARVVERDRGVLDKCLEGLGVGAVSTARDFQEPEDPAARPEREALRSRVGVISGRADPHLERREQPVGLRLDSAHAVALTGRRDQIAKTLQKLLPVGAHIAESSARSPAGSLSMWPNISEVRHRSPGAPTEANRTSMSASSAYRERSK